MNSNHNLPLGRKLQRFMPLLEMIEPNTNSNTPRKQSKRSCLSDSIDILQFQPFVHYRQIQLMDYIYNSIYQMKIQIKRMDYLADCNTKNADVMSKLEQNQRCLNKTVKK
ncbi:Hypothetical_protein [Hexamita inflata]|uniref:Hypothetical_protein n=1 Tax=Hexamita inflata TaxID=28002 RepID=A0AA86V539_9EUKA|nr:Hypothetical protein HINF_LOCUS64426 [Hexamita inflata]